MAAIVHRCACGHLDSFHAPSPKGDTAPCSMARCDCADVDPGAPEVIPTWRSETPFDQAQPDPALIEPGTDRSCDCEDCWSLYNAEHVAA
ncbi:hypothetical protein [Amycolatopsis sp. FDAARGOS 1241]|uniref:hypothetical protein n=1 Tax=Amycolatopsis sp. FDAARGOS 1241 TaxID=2778070 RepID=UPI00194DD4DF|nr:hypothetical protein [Amycolatopsis sp. FDAARGOS 1241]QRP47429.1 hypothetical protein I6J71_05530 [Amycolatopsis sp. FDAARGOS 1241]